VFESDTYSKNQQISSELSKNFIIAPRGIVYFTGQLGEKVEMTQDAILCHKIASSFALLIEKVLW
jgi:hypothetical protein